MEPPITDLFGKLERLSAVELERSAERFARRERRNSAGLIAHLAEISRRRLHLDLGYKNLFEYVTRRLGFDEGAAGLRIHVAKAVPRFPQILASLARGEISLSVAALLVPHLEPDTVERLLADSAGKSKRETEEYLVRLQPKEAFEPGIRKQPERQRIEEATAPVPALKPVAPPPREAQAPRVPEEPAGVPALEAAVRREPVVPRKTPNVLEPATAETYNFRFSASRTFRKKLERLGEVLGVHDPIRSMGEILEKAVDCLLERKDPQRRHARRLEREERRRAQRPDDVAGAKIAEEPGPEEPGSAGGSESAAAQDPPSPTLPAVSPRADSPGGGAASEVASPARSRGESRRPPAEIWDRVLERAGYRCEFTGRVPPAAWRATRRGSGRRCTARTGLEPDHWPVPWSRSKSHDEDGIRAHCRAHNALTAREYFGDAYMDARIEETRRRRQAREGANAPLGVGGEVGAGTRGVTSGG